MGNVLLTKKRFFDKKAGAKLIAPACSSLTQPSPMEWERVSIRTGEGGLAAKAYTTILETGLLQSLGPAEPTALA
jgi:hypothetical protein